MSSSLTDEEKTRLVLLLSDITNTGQSLKKPSFKPIEFKNAFKFNELEKQGLKTINNKLKTLQEMCDDADLGGKSSSALEQNENIQAEAAATTVSVTDGEGEDSNCHEWEEYRQAKDKQCQHIDNELDKLKENSLETEGETNED